MGQVLFAPALAGCTSDDVTASAAQVLSGYTALTKDSNDDPISGTMTNRGAWTSSSSGSGHIAIPAGYHNGSGYVDCSGAYNAGVTAADARTNTSSANYKAGYNSGKSNVTLSASASGRTVTATASNGKTASASVAYAGSNGAVSVSTSGGSGNQSFDITDGWCTSINVDRTGAYNAGVTAADARTNTSSANYKAGYNAGVTAADARTNTSSANYKAGYNAGYSAIFNATPTRPGASVSEALSSRDALRRTLRLSSGITYGFIFYTGGWADDTNVNFTGASISAGSLTQIANGKKQYSNYSDYGLINEGWGSQACYIGLIRNAPAGAVITITTTVGNSLVANMAYLIKII